MSDLRDALVSGGHYEESEVDEAIAEMYQRMQEGENPEDILYEEGLEPDYVFDLIYYKPD